MDPLRAGHVAILDGAFRYFCRAECKQAFLRGQEDVPTAAPPEVAIATNGANGHAASHARPRVFAIASETDAERAFDPPIDPLPDLDESFPSAPLTLRSPLSRRSATRFERAVATIDAAGVSLGVLVPAIGLLGAVADVARLPLAALAWTALAVRIVLSRRDAADAHPVVALAPTLGALGAAFWAYAIRDAHATAIATLAGLSCASGIAVEMIVGRARARVTATRQHIEQALDVRVRALRGDETFDMAASDVRPGEPIVVEAGEVVGVDATVTAGEARVWPWLDSNVEAVRREGESIVAGARVMSSRLRLTTTWSGRERAWVKLLCDSPMRIDVASPTARTMRLSVQRGMPLAAVLSAMAAFAANATPVDVLAAACAGAVAFGAKAAASMVALHFARAHLAALQGGIAYKDARAFERAGAAHVAVLCARGTVLMGEPEIVAIEAIGAFDLDRVLSLAAGAETASTHPFAAAILRAARARAVRPDHVRNAAAHAGLGVTALASSGERLVVGGRAIMLTERIGVAVADARTTELEAQGRSVLLVALGDRLVGLVALQDGLRAGARGAVQKLLDARIEPVLLSGEARDTCETIGRALDVEHVRPEVLPADRGPSVRALAEGGNVVAVVGHPVRDDGALGAADVGIAMGAAGSTPGEWGAALASDDVRDAAMALAIPHATRDRVRLAIAIGAGPGLVALLAMAFGIAPLAAAPVAALVGAAAVAVQAREN